jgi:hypothetical protein
LGGNCATQGTSYRAVTTTRGMTPLSPPAFPYAAQVEVLADEVRTQVV